MLLRGGLVLRQPGKVWEISCFAAVHLGIAVILETRVVVVVVVVVVVARVAVVIIVAHS